MCGGEIHNRMDPYDGTKLQAGPNRDEQEDKGDVLPHGFACMQLCWKIKIGLILMNLGFETRHSESATLIFLAKKKKLL